MKIERYPKTNDRSLRAWASADEYILKHLDDINIDNKNVAIYNDRFGFLSVHLHDSKPVVVTTYKSQENSIKANAVANGVDDSKIDFSNPLSEIKSVEIALVKIPKSLDLFRLFLQHIVDNSSDDIEVVCGFMTKYFSKQMITIAETYFEDVQQSLAWKKSRLIKLKKPKNNIRTEIINKISYQDLENSAQAIQQYFGVFSAKHIDYATQFLIDHLYLEGGIKKVLDLASGNGIIAHQLDKLKADLEIHLMDDSYLAIESSKLNLSGNNFTYHYAYNLDYIEDNYFDMVVSNPPFHFEHENSIDIALGLFHGVHRVLTEDGKFVCVANNHLNYSTHLKRIFDQVDEVEKNDKFVIYECWK